MANRCETTFLNGYLEEDIYIEQPLDSYIQWWRSQSLQATKIHLWLKKASWSWNTQFNNAIKSFDFIKNEEELCVFKKVSRRSITLLVLYMDAILLIENDILMMTSVKFWLSKEFSMKDLGEASYILEIKWKKYVIHIIWPREKIE